MKKILSVLLSMILWICAIPLNATPVHAAAAPVNVYIMSVAVDQEIQNDKNGKPMIYRELTVTDYDEDGKLMLSDLLISLHKEYFDYSDSFTGATGYSSENKADRIHLWGKQGIIEFFSEKNHSKNNFSKVTVNEGEHITLGLRSNGDAKDDTNGANVAGAATPFFVKVQNNNAAFNANSIYTVIGNGVSSGSEFQIGFGCKDKMLGSTAKNYEIDTQQSSIEAYKVNKGELVLSTKIEAGWYKSDSTNNPERSVASLTFPEEGEYVVLGKYAGKKSDVDVAPGSVATCVIHVESDAPKAEDISGLFISLDENGENILSPTFNSDTAEYAVSIPMATEMAYVSLKANRVFSSETLWEAICKDEYGNDVFLAAGVPLSTEEVFTAINTSYITAGSPKIRINVYDKKTGKRHFGYNIAFKRIVELSGLETDLIEPSPFVPNEGTHVSYLPSDKDTIEVKPIVEGDGFLININGANTDANKAFTISRESLTFDDKGESRVPIKLSRAGDAYADNEYALIIRKVPDDDTPTFIENIKKKAEYIVGDEAAALDVYATAKEAVAYQWYTSEDGKSDNGELISDAIDRSFTPRTDKAGTYYYYCTATSNENTAVSEVAEVTVYPDPTPKVKWAMEIPKLPEEQSDRFIQGDIQITDGFYYKVGDSASKIEAVASSSAEDIEIKYTYYLWRGGNNEGVYSIEKSITPDTRLASGMCTYQVVASCELLGRTFETERLPVYVFVARSIKSHPDNANELWQGSGTEADPWKIASQSDLEKIRTAVSEGYYFEDDFFAMTGDISLDGKWVSIGSGSSTGRGSNINPFSGTFNGGGYTLSYAENSNQSLFKYVREANVENMSIYAPYIANYGLVSDYVVDYGEDGNYNIGYGGSFSQGCPDTINIKNVTIKTGSNILYSGFLGGVASGGNVVNVENCTIESGVNIGKNKLSGIPAETTVGGFLGTLNGTVTNSSCHANVYGKNAGGLVGAKGQSMGPCAIVNCIFDGKVMSNGNAGGIIASGYGSGTAPNTPCVQINNCLVNADITGAGNVGGIIGGEPACIQAWANGSGGVKNSVVYAKITSTNENGNVGGIIGYMRSLNAGNMIENNYYCVSNRDVDGIGVVDYVDTSASHETDSKVTYINTSVSLPGISGITHRNFNRTDDPLGADKDRLAKAVSAEDMANSTVVLLLNESDSSLRNWAQGELTPVFSDEKVLYALTISGDYKTEYYLNEEIDLTNAVITGLWNDGSTSTIDTDQITLYGYDKAKRGTQTVEMSYGGATGSFTVTVLKKPSASGNNDITVYLSLMGDTLHGESDDVHTLKSGNLIEWIPRKAYTVDVNATLKDVLEKALKSETTHTYMVNNPSGNYVESIVRDGVKLGEFDNGPNSGWMYTLNGKHPNLGVMEQYFEDKDIVIFHYTDDFMLEDNAEEMSRGGSKSTSNTIVESGDTVSSEIVTETKPAVVEEVAATAALDASTGEAKASVSAEEVSKAVENAKASEADVIEFTADVKAADGSSAEADKVSVEIPKTSAESIAKETDAAVTVKTDIASCLC